MSPSSPTTGRVAEVYSAVPTPFTSDGAVDVDLFRTLVQRIAPHVDGAFVAGTTGEFPALDDVERRSLFEAAVGVLGAARVIAHVGAASVQQTIGLAGTAAALGIGRVAAITPYYLPCDFPTLRDGYRRLAQAFPALRVLVYVYPERTGQEVSPQELGELLALPGVVGAKLSGRTNERFADYVAAAGPSARLYSGGNDAYPAVVAAGGRGLVSSVSSVYPERYAALSRALRAGDEAAVAAAQEAVLEVAPLLAPTIPRLKAALAHRHGETWRSRMSMSAVDDDTAKRIAALA